MIEVKNHVETMALKIINDAKNEAEEIRRQTENMANDTLSKINAAKEDVKTLKLNISDMVRICENRINSIEQNFTSVEDSVSKLCPDAEGDVFTEDPLEREFF